MGKANSHLAAAIADGARLSVFLEPEFEKSTLAHPRPHYIESYPLPHVCVKEGQVWGATRRTHLIARPAGPCVWRDTQPNNLNALNASIQAGNEHYITFIDQNDILRSHPLDLAFLFPDSGAVEFRIEHAALPEVFYDPVAFETKLSRSVPDLDKALASPTFGGQSAMAAYLTFRCIDGSGTAYGVPDIQPDTRHACTNVKVYSTP